MYVYNGMKSGDFVKLYEYNDLKSADFIPK